MPVFVSVEQEFWIPVVSGTPDSLSCIVDSKSSGSRIPRAKFPGLQIPLARFPYMVRTIRQHNNALLWTFYGNSKLTADCLSQSRRKLQPYYISGSSIIVQSGTIRSNFTCRLRSSKKLRFHFLAI